MTLGRRQPFSLRVGLVFDDCLTRPGGVQQHLLTLASGLQELGHVPMFIVGDSSVQVCNGADVVALGRNVPVRFNGNALTTPVAARRRRTVRTVAELGLDVVHVQMPYSPLMSGRVLAGATDRTAVIGTFHVASERMLALAGARLLRKLTHHTDRRFDKIIAVSNAAAGFARRTFGFGPVQVIPNMISPSNLVRPLAGCPEERVRGRIACVGSLVPRKGIATLIDAYEMLRAHNQLPPLMIAGDGPLRAELEHQIRRRRLASHVHLLGTVTEETKRRLLASTELACFPSRFGESFGIVLIEAIAAGSSVVLGGDNLGHRELLQNRQEVLVNGNCPTEICRKLGILLDSPERRNLLHQWQQGLLSRFISTRVVPQVVATYCSALAERRDWTDGHKDLVPLRAA